MNPNLRTVWSVPSCPTAIFSDHHISSWKMSKISHNSMVEEFWSCACGRWLWWVTSANSEFYKLATLVSFNALEPVYYTEWHKKSTWQVTGLWTRGPLKVLNGTKLILDDQGNHLDSFRIRLESFRSLRGHVSNQQNSHWSGTFLAAWYKNTALDHKSLQ